MTGGSKEPDPRRFCARLRLTRLEEHREVEWPFLDWMVPTARGGYVLPDRPERLPLMYSLEAVKAVEDA